MFTVKVGVVPGAINEVVVENATSVREILGLASLETTGYQIRLNGSNVTEDTMITGESTLLLSRMIKGNSTFTVKVGVVPGAINEYVFEGETTVASILATASLDANGHSIRLNGTVVDNTATVSGDATILLAKMIKGNRKAI